MSDIYIYIYIYIYIHTTHSFCPNSLSSPQPAKAKLNGRFCIRQKKKTMVSIVLERLLEHTVRTFKKRFEINTDYCRDKQQCFGWMFTSVKGMQVCM